jgi:hypothetical protein
VKGFNRNWGFHLKDNSISRFAAEKKKVSNPRICTEMSPPKGPSTLAFFASVVPSAMAPPRNCSRCFLPNARKTSEVVRRRRHRGRDNGPKKCQCRQPLTLFEPFFFSETAASFSTSFSFAAGEAVADPEAPVVLVDLVALDAIAVGRDTRASCVLVPCFVPSFRLFVSFLFSRLSLSLIFVFGDARLFAFANNLQQIQFR